MKTRYISTITFDCNALHPDAPGSTGHKYNDTYTIDSNYFDGREAIDDYISEDLMLVAGGGYSTSTIENYNITISREA